MMLRLLVVTDLEGEMCNMGLSNRVHAVLVGISAGFGALGTTAAAIPDFVPLEYRCQLRSLYG